MAPEKFCIKLLMPPLKCDSERTCKWQTPESKSVDLQDVIFEAKRFDRGAKALEDWVNITVKSALVEAEDGLKDAGTYPFSRGALALPIFE